MTTTAGCAILSDPLHESVVAGVRLWCGRATLCLKIGGAATAGAPRKRAEMLAGAVDLALSCPAPTRRGRARTRGGEGLLVRTGAGAADPLVGRMVSKRFQLNLPVFGALHGARLRIVSGGALVPGAHEPSPQRRLLPATKEEIQARVC